MPQHQNLGMLQRANVHLRQLLARGARRPLLHMHAGNHVVAVAEHHVLQQDAPVVGPAQAAVHWHVPAIQMAVQVDDVGLAAADQAHFTPRARPAKVVEEVLIVAHVEPLVARGASRGVHHAREVIGGPLDRRIRMTREDRVRMDVAGRVRHVTRTAP